MSKQAPRFEIETTYLVYDNANGAKITVSMDDDSLDMVQITPDEFFSAGKSAILMQPELAEKLAEALLLVVADIKKREKEFI